MRVDTTRFGQLESVEVPEQALLRLPRGLYGFEAHRDFALIEEARYLPFRWLQALDDPCLRFVLLPPAVIDPGYAPELSSADLELLELEPGERHEMYAIVVGPRDLRAMTANLKAPLVINPRRRLALQVILSDERYSLRHPVAAGAVQLAADGRAAC